jgi:hypothetical protein
MIWPRTKRIRSIAGGVINSAEGYANRTAYLVWQGQQEVIEEDCSDRNCIVLVPIPCQYSRSKKSTLTLDAVLRILVSKRLVSLVMDRTEGRGLTVYSRGR